MNQWFERDFAPSRHIQLQFFPGIRASTQARVVSVRSTFAQVWVIATLNHKTRAICFSTLNPIILAADIAIRS